MVMNYRIYKGTFNIPAERDFLAKIREIAESESLYIVFFNRSAIAGCDHIRAALSFAERSFFEYRKPVSNFFEMEVLLYTLGTRQTGIASGFGIHKGQNDSVILICRREKEPEEGSRTAAESFEDAANRAAAGISSLEERTGTEPRPLTGERCLETFENRSGEEISRLAEIFSIGPEEIKMCGKNRIEELVIERCSLLDVNK